MFGIVVLAPSNLMVKRVATSVGKDPTELRFLSNTAFYLGALDAHPTYQLGSSQHSWFSVSNVRDIATSPVKYYDISYMN